MIKKTDPELIFIGIGSPKQHFVAYNLLKVNKPIVAVGAAFSFVSGRIPQAPSWVGKLGFEWLFRLLKEPKRLWKRYLIFGPLFAILVVAQKFHNKDNENSSNSQLLSL